MVRVCKFVLKGFKTIFFLNILSIYIYIQGSKLQHCWKSGDWATDIPEPEYAEGKIKQPTVAYNDRLCLGDYS